MEEGYVLDSLVDLSLPLKFCNSHEVGFSFDKVDYSPLANGHVLSLVKLVERGELEFVEVLSSVAVAETLVEVGIDLDQLDKVQGGWPQSALLHQLLKLCVLLLRLADTVHGLDLLRLVFGVDCVLLDP